MRNGHDCDVSDVYLPDVLDYCDFLDGLGDVMFAMSMTSWMTVMSMCP